MAKKAARGPAKGKKVSTAKKRAAGSGAGKTKNTKARGSAKPAGRRAGAASSKSKRPATKKKVAAPARTAKAKRPAARAKSKPRPAARAPRKAPRAEPMAASGMGPGASEEPLQEITIVAGSFGSPEPLDIPSAAIPAEDLEVEYEVELGDDDGLNGEEPEIV